MTDFGFRISDLSLNFYISIYYPIPRGCKSEIQNPKSEIRNGKRIHLLFA